MNQILQQELTGTPVTVSLGGAEYPLAFPIYACMLYKQETAKLDRARRDSKPRLTPVEIKELKQQRRELLQLADDVKPELSDGTTPEDAAEQIADFYQLIGDAMEISTRLDENRAAGDSLFLEANWIKINTGDPERLVLALWAGLHYSVDDEWKAPFSLKELNSLVDPANAEDIVEVIGKALRVYSAKKKVMSDLNREAENPSKPKATKNSKRHRESASPISGASPASISDSPTVNS